jgi:hypothetical protein
VLNSTIESFVESDKRNEEQLRQHLQDELFQIFLRNVKKEDVQIQFFIYDEKVNSATIDNPNAWVSEYFIQFQWRKEVLVRMQLCKEEYDLMNRVFGYRNTITLNQLAEWSGV